MICSVPARTESSEAISIHTRLGVVTEDLRTSRALDEVAVDLQYSQVKANLQMHHIFASDEDLY